MTTTARSLILDALKDGCEISFREIENKIDCKEFTTAIYQSSLRYLVGRKFVTVVFSGGNAYIYKLNTERSVDEISNVINYNGSTSSRVYMALKNSDGMIPEQISSQLNLTTKQVSNAISHLVASCKVVLIGRRHSKNIYKEARDFTIQPKSKSQPRKCLRCTGIFLSKGKGNRVCAPCKKLNSELSGGFSEMAANA